jgi:phosphonate transport system permease protein
VSSTADAAAPRPATPPQPPPPRPRRPGGRAAGALLILVVAAWSVRGTGVGVGALLEGRVGAARFVGGLLRPDLSAEFLALVTVAAVETVQIAVAGLVLAVAVGLPLAVLQAGNGGAPATVRRTARLVATGLRGFPELLWALLFVATVGLGPPAGVLAIALHGAGLLAKLCSEVLEAVDPAPVEALELTGAGRAVTVPFAIVPQAAPGLVSLVLYQLECNIRTATVVGFVGAGGIGQSLDIALRLFRYDELSTLVLTVLALIVGVDALSRVARRRVGATA